MNAWGTAVVVDPHLLESLRFEVADLKRLRRRLIVCAYGLAALVTVTLQRRVWQAPLLAMFSVTFLGTILLNLLTFIALRIGGVIMSVEDVLGLLILPSVLLNLLLAIPIYAIMRDLSRWVYPTPEVE